MHKQKQILVGLGLAVIGTMVVLSTVHKNQAQEASLLAQTFSSTALSSAQSTVFSSITLSSQASSAISSQQSTVFSSIVLSSQASSALSSQQSTIFSSVSLSSAFSSQQSTVFSSVSLSSQASSTIVSSQASSTIVSSQASSTVVSSQASSTVVSSQASSTTSFASSTTSFASTSSLGGIGGNNGGNNGGNTGGSTGGGDFGDFGGLIGIGGVSGGSVGGSTGGSTGGGGGGRPQKSAEPAKASDCKSDDKAKAGCIPLIQPLGTKNTIEIKPGPDSFIEYFNEAADLLLTAAIGFCVLWILIGSYLVMISGSDGGKRSQGKEIITWAIIGLIIVNFAGFFLRTLNSIFFV